MLASSLLAGTDPAAFWWRGQTLPKQTLPKLDGDRPGGCGESDLLAGEFYLPWRMGVIAGGLIAVGVCPRRWGQLGSCRPAA